MSILTYRNSELMNTRYKASEAKNQGNNLTVATDAKAAPKGMARMKADKLHDDLTTIPEVDSAACFDELLEGGH